MQAVYVYGGIKKSPKNIYIPSTYLKRNSAPTPVSPLGRDSNVFDYKAPNINAPKRLYLLE